MATNLANAQDLVNIEDIRQGAVILKGGKLVKIIMVSGVNFSLKSEQEQGIITYAYQNFLNGIDFPLQIVIHSRKINIEKYLASLEKRQAEETSGLLQSQIAEYREFVGAFVKENPIMAKTFLVAVPFVPGGMSQAKGVGGFFPFFKKDAKSAAEKAAQATQENFEHNLSQLDQRANQVLEGLRAINLEAIVLNDEALIELFYNFYNPETVEKENLNLPTKKEK